ncbi:RNA-directed DNA polymerase (plasmid) [Apilactobacillus apisilvae]|uniref:RNA-directed DNA polymerase n=1 Tax=Apilactobacillus apisilvae TaxID=2923364 RepID=A0ABY4PKP2_9LACO|nr:RNA-directed DNA polymerase [Apilactobacillus apisilvae]UQS85797.1 RNA-directed DNA polymerase [Apilactobacillus apisilvae]
MKRYGHLYDKVADSAVINLAIDQASRGKRRRRDVKRVLENRELYVMKIQDMLLSESYQPSHIREIKINERGKERIITSSKFYPDQIIHWALVLVLEPIFYRSMYHYCLATVKGRGGALGKRAVEKWLKNDPKNTKYCLKLDIHHFYPSIDHDVLKIKLSDRFKDKRLLKVLFDIIDCYPKGLPLGLYTSQWFANFFLESLDHKIKEQWQASYYVRYMDDMVIFGCNKKKLHKLKNKINEEVKIYHLSIKDNWQVFRTDSRPIDFLGFKFYRDHTTIRRRNFLRIRRKVAKISKKSRPSVGDAHSMLSYYGWIKNSDSFKFYNEQIKLKFSVKAAKGVLKYARNARKNDD